MEIYFGICWMHIYSRNCIDALVNYVHKETCDKNYNTNIYSYHYCKYYCYHCYYCYYYCYYYYYYYYYYY